GPGPNPAPGTGGGASAAARARSRARAGVAMVAAITTTASTRMFPVIRRRVLLQSPASPDADDPGSLDTALGFEAVEVDAGRKRVSLVVAPVPGDRVDAGTRPR